MRAPKSSKNPLGTIAVGMIIGSGPKTTISKFCRKIETPIAESNAMMRERPRNGRYAMRSISQPRSAVRPTESTIASTK